jgi:glycosyltransferase involved in cell wall biosynthesis
MSIEIISYPIIPAFYTPLNHLISVVKDTSLDSVTVSIITNDKARFNNDLASDIQCSNWTEEKSIIGRLSSFTRMELDIANKIFKNRRCINIIIFFMEGDALIPILVSKLCRIKVIKMLPSGIVDSKLKLNHSDHFLLLANIMQKVTNKNANIVGIYSERLINEWGLGYIDHSKIRIIGEHFVDMGRFNITKPYQQRNEEIAFIGRLDEEKGIINFVNSIPKILENKESIIVNILGSGKLSALVEEMCEILKIKGRVKLSSWVDYSDVPRIINNQQLVVIPSYTEGLPNIMLEAMACGTPVVANSVGAIPDVIIDGKNGFLLSNNSSDEISATVIRALNDKSLNLVSKNAISTIEKDFNILNVIKKWQGLFLELGIKPS